VFSPAFRAGLTDRSEPPMRVLPADVGRLLERLHAPPRLVAHLRAVHDVAGRPTDTLGTRLVRS